MRTVPIVGRHNLEARVPSFAQALGLDEDESSFVRFAVGLEEKSGIPKTSHVAGALSELITVAGLWALSKIAEDAAKGPADASDQWQNTIVLGLYNGFDALVTDERRLESLKKQLIRARADDIRS